MERTVSKRVSIGLTELLDLLRTLEGASSDALQDSAGAILRSIDVASLDADDRDLLRGHLQVLREPREPARRTSGFQEVASLRARERETLELLLTGASEKQIAASLGISTHTVHQYVKRLYRYLGVTSRAQLMAACLKQA